MPEPTCQELCDSKATKQAEIDAVSALLSAHQAYVAVYEQQLMTKTMELNQIQQQIADFPGGCTC